ncbi:hypothetical protein AB0G02_28040, partial [Actinosynnema sp. NPDC023658]|uniref:hypothetical protein n=1 Tax=Actinosynnema sp. NPDC023658 TaxID=3155465 RepID=UPI0033D17879
MTREIVVGGGSVSHREVPRSGRGCVSAVVGLPVVAMGGVAALVLVFGQPEPPSSVPGGVPGATRQTLVSVSVRTSALPVPVPRVGVEPVVTRSAATAQDPEA